VLTDPLHIALNALFAHYGGSKREALVAHEDRRNVATFFGATVPQQWSWPHAHHLDAAALQSLVFSRSYMPDKDSPTGQQAGVDLREIFERLAVDGVVAVRYTTVAMLGRPQ
jgi:S-adenosylmethionine:diacylglycerol 3-amino-3-carboxypropyl transferase